jgi:hypothetical protein
LVKPVPVKTTTVPLGAPAARPTGVCDVITGPATERPAGNGALEAAVFVTTTLSGPADAPVAATETLNVTAVPELPEGLLKVTPAAGVVVVPTNAAADEYWLRPVPVKVTVDAGAPGMIAVVALVAVTVGATVLASPMPRAPGRANDAALPPLITEGFATVTPQSSAVGVTPEVTAITAVIDDALTTEELATAP